MKIISSELYVKDNKVYHEGNKPKPKDIGAAPETHTHNYASATTPGGSAEHAIKATEDSLGQRIDKYIKGLSVSGRTITYTRGDGTTGTITTQDTNTTYSVGTASALGLTKLYTGTGTATDGTMTQNAINTALNGKANSSHAHSSLKGTVGSTIAPSTGTGVMRYDYNVLPENAGTLPNINNANGILTLSTHAGNYYSQLGFSSNGSLYYRAFNGVALDTTTAWKQVAFTNSSITGNAGTATKLQTARSINGTNFDGTGNITTANWGTARNLNGVSVNGSTNYTIPVENYYCTVGNNNTNLYHRILTTDIETVNYIDKSLIIVMNSGYNGGGFGIAKITFRTDDISSAANSRGEINWLVRNRFAENALVFNFVNQAKNACMDVFYKSPGNYSGMTWYVLSEGGGRGEKHSSKQWTKYNTNASGTNAYTEANMKTLRTYTSTLVSATDAGHVSTANSASTLSTARTINGTSFNGSANITTANWGTARTLTIGKTGKSVNGSGNVSWTFDEIASGQTVNSAIYLKQDYLIHKADNAGGTNGYLHVAEIKISKAHQNQVLCISYIQRGHNQLNTVEIQFINHSSTDPSLGTILKTGNTNVYIHKADTSTWNLYIQKTESYDCIDIVGFKKGAYSSGITVTWKNTNVTSLPSGYVTATLKTTVSNISGNSATATKLATARTINGTSFDGSGNITTANWGTARNIQIGNTSKSVNGSANVSWSLSEIGAAAASHTHNYAGSSSAGGAANSANLLNIAGGRAASANSAVIVGPNTSMMLSTSSMTTGKPASDGYITEYRWDNNGGWSAQLFVPNNTTGVMQYRSMNAGTWGNWNTIYSTCNPQTTITGNAGTATKLQTARTIALGGILSGSASFDGSGNVTINAAANDITTITKSLNVTTSWMDTGITGSNLGTGTYAVQMYINNGANTGHYNEYYSGIMSWYADGTNSTDADEILLHKAGHASNERHVYLRTIRTPKSGYLKLQISCTHAFSAASGITFKFKKLI